MLGDISYLKLLYNPRVNIVFSIQRDKRQPKTKARTQVALSGLCRVFIG